MSSEYKDYSVENSTVINKFQRRKDRMEADQEALSEKFKEFISEALKDEQTKQNLAKEAYTATQTAPGSQKEFKTGFGGPVFINDLDSYKD